MAILEQILFYMVLILVLGFVSWTIVLVLRYWALKQGIFDIPNQRSMHYLPTPRGGGLAIIVIVLSGWLIYCIFVPLRQPTFTVSYAFGSILLAAVSWMDDLRSLSPRIRFLVHSLAALFIIFGAGIGDRILAWEDKDWFFMVFISAVSYVWIVGMINAYNFMDGIDGMAGSQAVIAGSGLLAIGELSEHPQVSLLGMLLAAGSIGFLMHNRPPARIFMGDVGSTFLGYSFAIIPFLAYKHEPYLIIGGALLVWPFIFDTSITFFRRLIRGEPIFQAHRSHLYQRLALCGWSHGQVSFLYGCLSLLGMFCAILLTVCRDPWVYYLLLIFPLLGVSLWIFVLFQERKQGLRSGLLQR